MFKEIIFKTNALKLLSKLYLPIIELQYLLNILYLLFLS